MHLKSDERKFRGFSSDRRWEWWEEEGERITLPECS